MAATGRTRAVPYPKQPGTRQNQHAHLLEHQDVPAQPVTLEDAHE